MSVNPSPIGGYAGQFFDNNGVILSGGKIYTYAAGTTTPQATYTSAAGVTPHANPIILDSAGRVPGGEIWLTDGLVYKFVIETSTAILIGTYDNITGVNSNFVNYTIQEEVITATAGQTVFNLSTINYTPGTNSLSVYIDGVNQYVGDSYLETDSNTVTFTSGVHVGGEVKFTTAVQTTTGAVNASIVVYDPPFTGGVSTDVENKLSQFVSINDFGGVGDGTTDDTAAVQAADAWGAHTYSPEGTYDTTLASTAITGPYWGSGQIRDTSNNKRGPWFSAVTAAPSPQGNDASIETAFNGDLAHTQIAMEHRITGTATLGQPTTGYKYTPEAYPYYGYLYNSSGWNQGTATNVGRTAAAFFRVKVDNYGQGDAVCYNGTAFVSGTRAGSTNWLANPAASLFNGDMTGGADGVYLNPRELSLQDNGYDVACIGDVINLIRTNDTGAKSTVWTGYRVQSTGGTPVNNIMAATGSFNTGIDFSMSGLDFGTNKAAISLKRNDRIYFNNAATASGNLDADWATTVFNGDYLTYSDTISGLIFVLGGSARLQITTAQVTVDQARLTATNRVQFTALGNYANDAAAAAGGVNVNELYRNGSVVQIRVV
jgi:hypothetical protein